MTEETKRPLIQSVTRAIAILQCFSTYQELGLTEISRMIGLHKSTTAGLIHTLKSERFLELNEKTGKLRLGSALYLLTVNSRLRLEDICEPYLSELLHDTGETVNMGIRDGNEVVYIAKKESPHSMRISTSVGQRMPLYCTAIGKAILAFTKPETVDRILMDTELISFTTKTMTNREALLCSLADVRQEGRAYDREELEYGLICVAAPVFQRGEEPIGAISVSGPSMRMSDDRLEAISAQVTAIADKINAELRKSS